MPSVILRLLPFLSLLSLFAVPAERSADGRPQPGGGLQAVTAYNGMSIDPNGGDTPGTSPVTIVEPNDRGR